MPKISKKKDRKDPKKDWGESGSEEENTHVEVAGRSTKGKTVQQVVQTRPAVSLGVTTTQAWREEMMKHSAFIFEINCIQQVV
ncbi:hypothetical protein GE061_007375 [Apolygus lucorum]|uniref:Uncharacterized protein n=1 Tax=Apolygus lucorum TaxID=248454 RepID=A0A6A4J5V3_APOLU|nr:hypothetical protein GE061_007375 [Apolygus lucorum]